MSTANSIQTNTEIVSVKILKDRFVDTRKRTTELCEPLEIEDYVPQPAVFVSPPKWHLAHTTWFFEEMILKKFAENYTVFNEHFGFLFNSYYNTVGERTKRAERGLMTRPTVKEVFAYRDHVDKGMIGLLSSQQDEAVLNILELGIQHEQQHQELLITDLKYTLSLNPIHPIYKNGFSLVESPQKPHQSWIKVEGGTQNIGKDYGVNFSFDNERPQHQVYTESFEINSALVTNGEYIEFINDGGYQTFSLWLDEGWHWKNREEINAPLYWKNIEGKWFYYTLEGLKSVSYDAPLAHISFYEANAYAAWKNARLPTEFEWEIASEEFNWGRRWEWTNSAYLPYPKFKAPKGAIGEYNGKFMINQMVLKGASTATSENHSRKTYRNFFPADSRWQVNGIRLVRDIL